MGVAWDKKGWVDWLYSIENSRAQKLDLKSIIDYFAERKARKMSEYSE